MSNLHTFEIINPSDPLTMLAPSLEVAAVAVAEISTQLGVSATIEGEEVSSPVLFGWDEWFQERGLDGDWFAQHRSQVVAALRSVALGDRNDRTDFEAAMLAITD